jgi:hypothetical protein
MLGGTSCCEPHAGCQVDTFLVTTDDARMDTSLEPMEDARMDTFLGPLGMLGGTPSTDPL